MALRTVGTIKLASVMVLLSWVGGPRFHAIAADPPAFDAPSFEFFEAKVRPILVERCQSCHGPEKQKGGLRLDSREAILKGGDTGPVVVERLPDESLLVEAIGYAEALQMPPRSKLPEQEIATLIRWVAMGLPWPATAGRNPSKPAVASNAFDLEERKGSHWAWRPIEDPTPPVVGDLDWPEGPIDRFILGGLEAKGLTPAPESDRRVLLRRLAFDLTGLPPTPAEISEFLDDDRPNATERLVDRLLASPRFGERWGRHWLDLVRFAETRGHEFDPLIPNAWRYRDYVVRALNADLPYDRFVTEQLAGDLLPDPRVDPTTLANESILGTGFWFLGEEVHSPVDIRQDETDRMDNRLDVMTKTFLGLTVACARCHDHKFDAIPQTDYYALTGFLLSSTYRQVRFTTMAAERASAEHWRSLKETDGPRVLAELAEALSPGIEGAVRSHTQTGARSDDGPKEDPWGLTKSTARRVAPEDDAPRMVVNFGAEPDLERWQNGTAFGLRPAEPGDLRIADGPDGLRIGVHDLATSVREAGSPHLAPLKSDDRDHGKLGEGERAGQTLRSPEFTLKSGRLWYLVRGDGRAYASVNAHLVIAGPLHSAALLDWKPDGSQHRWRWISHNLKAYQGHRLHVEFFPEGTGELSVARVVDSEDEPSPLGLLPDLGDPRGESAASTLESLFVEAAGRLKAGTLGESPELAAVADWMLARPGLFLKPGSPEERTFRDATNRLLKERQALASIVPTASPTAPAMLDGNGVNEYLLIRGSSKTPGDVVPRRFLSAIDGFATLEPTKGSGRLWLASRMLDPANPFPARVLVNRVWHHLFGRGIVASVDNFGVLGEPPTHPELLDHLATVFVRDGWSIKRLIRSIVLSKTYQMSSTPMTAEDEADPGNRLWHRRELRRLEAEPIRDAILAVSGGLVEQVGGPSVPVHLNEFLQGRGRPNATGPVDGQGRRSLYLMIRRNFLSPLMLAFDAPIPFSTMGRRNVSNVPGQALILMNDPFVAGEAQRGASRIIHSGRSKEVAVTDLFLRAMGRKPDPRERAEALAFLGEAPDADAWADLGHVLFNAKEFLFLE